MSSAGWSRWASTRSRSAAAHAARAATLPLIHRDPWDRILVAQAQSEGLVILTADDTIRRYDVETIW